MPVHTFDPGNPCSPLSPLEPYRQKRLSVRGKCVVRARACVCAHVCACVHVYATTYRWTWLANLPWWSGLTLGRKENVRNREHHINSNLRHTKGSNLASFHGDYLHNKQDGHG